MQRDHSGFNLARHSPFLYRSYIYDWETQLYYLNSRYYDPEIGRFLNPDDPAAIATTTELSPNAYSYCRNDPVNHIDSTGYAFETVADVASLIWSIVDLAKNPSWLNLSFAAWDLASIFVPFLPGSYLTKAGKTIKFFATKADDFVEGADILVDSYKNLKKFFKGSKKIEVHHIIEKRFRTLFRGIDVDDYISIAIDKDFHKSITKRWRKIFPYGTKYTKIKKSEMIKAVKEVYKNMPELMEIALDWVKKNWNKVN